MITLTQIQALGNFLANYSTDLYYIRRFKEFKASPETLSQYIKKDAGSFYSFLIEFRVARNFTQGAVDKLLHETLAWVNSTDADDVDSFAERLASAGLTRGHIMSSMASKILFLNNPWKIIPMDRLARKALNQKENSYSIYYPKLDEFRSFHQLSLGECTEFVRPFTRMIHEEFNDLQNLDKLSENRILDKLLWTLGK